MENNKYKKECLVHMRSSWVYRGTWGVRGRPVIWYEYQRLAAGPGGPEVRSASEALTTTCSPLPLERGKYGSTSHSTKNCDNWREMIIVAI
jgi:hypothetical protein